MRRRSGELGFSEVWPVTGYPVRVGPKLQQEDEFCCLQEVVKGRKVAVLLVPVRRCKVPILCRSISESEAQQFLVPGGFGKVVVDYQQIIWRQCP